MLERDMYHDKENPEFNPDEEVCARCGAPIIKGNKGFHSLAASLVYFVSVSLIDARKLVNALLEEIRA